MGFPARRSFEKKEIQAVLRELRGMYNAECAFRNVTMFRFMLLTGFRAKEVTLAQVKDVFDGKEVREEILLSKEKLKGKRRARSVDISPELKPDLKKLCVDREPTDYLFRSTHVGEPDEPPKPITRQWVWKLIKKACAAAKLDRQSLLGCHSTRKYFGQAMFAALSGNLIDTRDAMGHATVASTEHYLAANKPRISAAINAMSLEIEQEEKKD